MAFLRSLHGAKPLQFGRDYQRWRLNDVTVAAVSPTRNVINIETDDLLESDDPTYYRQLTMVVDDPRFMDAAEELLEEIERMTEGVAAIIPDIMEAYAAEEAGRRGIGTWVPVARVYTDYFDTMLRGEKAEPRSVPVVGKPAVIVHGSDAFIIQLLAAIHDVLRRKYMELGREVWSGESVEAAVPVVRELLRRVDEPFTIIVADNLWREQDDGYEVYGDEYEEMMENEKPLPAGYIVVTKRYAGQREPEVRVVRLVDSSVKDGEQAKNTEGHILGEREGRVKTVNELTPEERATLSEIWWLLPEVDQLFLRKWVGFTPTHAPGARRSTRHFIAARASAHTSSYSQGQKRSGAASLCLDACAPASRRRHCRASRAPVALY